MPIWRAPGTPPPVCRPRASASARLSLRRTGPAWSGFVHVSSVRLPLPAGAENLAWRVSAVARGLANYAVSGWSVFAVPPS